MRPRWSVTAVGIVLVLFAATSAQAGIVTTALEGLGGGLADGAGWFLSSCDRILATLRPLVTVESWETSGEGVQAASLVGHWDMGSSAGGDGSQLKDVFGSGFASREELAVAEPVPEFGRLLAEADLGPALATSEDASQACELGSIRAVVLDLAASAELEEVFAESSLRRKAPEPLSVLVWVFLGLTWVGVRAMRRVRNAEFGRGLTGRRNLARRQRWSDETRAAIRRIIETGSPR